MKATAKSGRPPLTEAQRTEEINAVAESYSARARAARMEQGKPEIVEDPTVLTLVSTWFGDDREAA